MCEWEESRGAGRGAHSREWKTGDRRGKPWRAVPAASMCHVSPPDDCCCCLRGGAGAVYCGRRKGGQEGWCEGTGGRPAGRHPGPGCSLHARCGHAAAHLAALALLAQHHLVRVPAGKRERVEESGVGGKGREPAKQACCSAAAHNQAGLRLRPCKAGARRLRDGGGQRQPRLRQRRLTARPCPCTAPARACCARWRQTGPQPPCQTWGGAGGAGGGSGGVSLRTGLPCEGSLAGAPFRPSRSRPCSCEWPQHAHRRPSAARASPLRAPLTRRSRWWCSSPP